MRSASAIVGLAVLFLSIPSLGQSPAEPPTAFEAASIKPNRVRDGTTRRIEPGGITYLDITLGEFIELAYGVQHYQLSAPDWVSNFGSSDRYDVVAKAARPVSFEQLKPMLGSLLVERFHLAFHRETREVPVYALTVAKNGPRLKPGDGGAARMVPDGTGGFSYKNWSMATLASALSIMKIVDRPVLDRTGLYGGFSFNANFSDIPNRPTGADIKDSVVNSDAVFSTLQEQLGLKLEAKKGPIDFIVIDHADKLPTAN